jgi:hypothetical protein
MLVLVFYPSSRACARPPETVQSQAEHDSGGTFFVTVAFGEPHSNRTRRTRVITARATPPLTPPPPEARRW